MKHENNNKNNKINFCYKRVQYKFINMVVVAEIVKLKIIINNVAKFS